MKENIFDKISNLLRTNKRYVSEEGELLKATVYSDIMTMNKELLSLLLSDGKIKEKFFVNIDGTLVFDKQKFAWVIDSKEFLPDSYTSYTNKIGLTSDGDFISNKRDVVLDFPYKDCVLEGGQTKDDQKRKEIFYNETLAGDEISRMLDPKILTNARRYSKDGVQENITLNDEDNLIIKGNNLIVLSCLLKRYEGDIKCIYIDPPYNTKNDSFNYNDSFNHSTWLTFMKNRLELALKILDEKGVIFVQCDDNEQAYLKVIMDDLFGRDNYVSTIVRKTRSSATTKSDAEIEKLEDYILVYFKNKSISKFNKFIVGSKEYPYKDTRGKYYTVLLQDNGPNGTRKARPNLYYPIYMNKQDGTFSLENKHDSIEILPKKHKNDDGTWMWSKDKFLKDYKDLEYRNGKIYIKHYYDKKEDQNKYRRLRNWIDDCLNLKGTKTLNSIFEKKGVFSNPKPEELLEKLVYISTEKNDLILDFHLGSGTTAAVAHKMGRRYIGVEQMDYIENVTVERMKKVIEGEQGGISKKVNWQGGGSFVYCELLENGNSLIKMIQSATESTISKIKGQVYKDERIVPYITEEELKKVDDEFNKLNLEEKKRALIRIIDKNKLYVNYSDIDNEEFNISEYDKKFTRSFYEVD
ncbi:MAG: site-specific DNA-methyltransferase [Finegoldia magna]|uniref:DNA methyltransferase n=1 Tax=Finegoldia TaxID=150022 RepID=UPI0012B0FB3E|nr:MULTISPECIES: site-specific DNA-methyltransferase [Finegoldia]MDU4334952.1 site-specific DNA-methyltransferase [Finegoldia magna]MSB11628.1 site-specific DNA-methyltransferase [Finegoldia sp. BIOML-A1]